MLVLACIAWCCNFFASADSLEQRFASSIEAVFDKGQLREMHVYPYSPLSPTACVFLLPNNKIVEFVCYICKSKYWMSCRVV